MLAAGTLLSRRYRVTQLLGSGTHGAVYLAEDIRLRRAVALKVVHDVAADGEARERLRREAVALARVTHPNVVRVLDWCTEPGEPSALVLELAPGETLKSRLAAGALPIFEVAALGQQLFGALAAIHDAGILHRDLKPANVMVEGGGGAALRARIVDFGLAKLHEATLLTETGALVGTPVYMAPEATRGVSPSAAGDVYAAGCVLYEALVGRRVFEGLSGAELYLAIRDGRTAPIAELRPDAPPALVAVVERAMAARPEDRFASAASARAALGGDDRDGGAGPSTTSGPTVDAPPPKARVTPGRRRWIPLAIAAGSLPVLTALATFVALRRGPRGSAAPTASLSPPPTVEASALATVEAPPSAETPTAQRASASADARRAPSGAPARPRTCRCLYESQGRLYNRLCLRLQPPLCTCHSHDDTLCAVAWQGEGSRIPTCAQRPTRTFPLGEEPQGQACEAFAYRHGASDLRAQGTWVCDYCSDPSHEVASAKHGEPCVGYTNLGATYRASGRWVCD